MRDTFLRLLKPGLDIRSTFLEHAEKKFRHMVDRGDANEEDKEDTIKSITLGKNEMRKLLISVGVSMKPAEV